MDRKPFLSQQFSRREFLRLVVGTSGVGALALAGCDAPPSSPPSDQAAQRVDSTSHADTYEFEILNPSGETAEAIVTRYRRKVLYVTSNGTTVAERADQDGSYIKMVYRPGAGNEPGELTEGIQWVIENCGGNISREQAEQRGSKVAAGIQSIPLVESITYLPQDPNANQAQISFLRVNPHPSLQEEVIGTSTPRVLYPEGFRPAAAIILAGPCRNSPAQDQFIEPGNW